MADAKTIPGDLQKLATSKSLAVRCDLAERLDAPPEILFFLANDLSEDVRLRVAHNASAPWEADQLLSKDACDEVRAALTDKIIERLERQEAEKKSKPSFFQRAVQRISKVFEDLVEDSVEYIRRKVARTIIAKGYFPKDLVVKLVNHQDREIAIYTINHALDFSDEELLGLLQSERDFVPMAIAHRPNLSAKVVDALVEKGDPESLECVVANASAAISSLAMNKIIDHAKDYLPLQESLVKRSDLDMEAIKHIALVASESIIKDLLLSRRFSKKEVNEIIKKVRERLDAEEMQTAISKVLSNQFYKPCLLSPADRAYQDFLKGHLNEGLLEQALECGQADYIISALALRSNLPQNTVVKAVEHQNAKAIISVVWRAGFSMRMATELQKRLLKLKTGIVYPKNGKHFPFTPQEMTWQINFFMGLGTIE